VRAGADTVVLEITADQFRQVVLSNPTAVEQVGLAVARRAAELDEHRSASGAASGPSEASHTFLTRVRRFLRLNFTS